MLSESFNHASLSIIHILKRHEFMVKLNKLGLLLFRGMFFSLQVWPGTLNSGYKGGLPTMSLFTPVN